MRRDPGDDVRDGSWRNENIESALERFARGFGALRLRFGLRRTRDSAVSGDDPPGGQYGIQKPSSARGGK